MKRYLLAPLAVVILVGVLAAACETEYEREGIRCILRVESSLAQRAEVGYDTEMETEFLTFQGVVRLPWEQDVYVEPGRQVSLLARPIAGGPITVKMYNGVEWGQHSGSGT